MKRPFAVLAVAAALLGALTLAPVARAASPVPSAALGFVDTQRIFQNYKEAQDAQSRFRKEAQSYQEELAEDQRKLEEARKAGKSQDEVAKMQKKFEEELRPKKSRVEGLDKDLSGKIKHKIEAAIAAVAKTRGFSAVLDKAVVLFGGTDLTDDVLKRLNKA